MTAQIEDVRLDLCELVARSAKNWGGSERDFYFLTEMLMDLVRKTDKLEATERELEETRAQLEKLRKNSSTRQKRYREARKATAGA